MACLVEVPGMTALVWGETEDLWIWGRGKVVGKDGMKGKLQSGYDICVNNRSNNNNKNNNNSNNNNGLSWLCITSLVFCLSHKKLATGFSRLFLSRLKSASLGSCKHWGVMLNIVHNIPCQWPLLFPDSISSLTRKYTIYFQLKLSIA